MIRVEKNLVASINRLKGNSDFKAVFEWIESSFREQQDVNIDLTGENGIRGQGKAEVLRDITTAFAEK